MSDATLPASPPAHEAAPTHYRSTSLPDPKLLMWIFLASDCMFFGSLIGTYLVYKGRSIQGPYPQDVFDIPLTTVSSFVLLMSSVFMVIALYYLRENDIPKFRLFTIGVCAFSARSFWAFRFTSSCTSFTRALTLATKPVRLDLFRADRDARGSRLYRGAVAAGDPRHLVLSTDYGSTTRFTSTWRRCTGTLSTSSGL